MKNSKPHLYLVAKAQEPHNYTIQEREASLEDKEYNDISEEDEDYLCGMITLY